LQFARRLWLIPSQRLRNPRRQPRFGKKHVKFQEKYNLPFSLLADEDHSVAEAYGVWGEKKFMGRTYDGIHRTTFVIDENGKIERIIAKVDTGNHAGQLLEV